MKLLVFCTLVIGFAAYSDAVVTFTTPAIGGTVPACSGMGSVTEGTASGVIETVAAAADAGALTVALDAATDVIFDYNSGNNQISIAVGNSIDYETSTTINVVMTLIEAKSCAESPDIARRKYYSCDYDEMRKCEQGTDAGDSDVKTSTCSISLVNVALAFTGVLPGKVVVPRAAASGDAIQTVTCSDGAGTFTFAKGAGSTNKIDVASNGAVTKSATAFDAGDTYFKVVITCTETGASTVTATLTVCVELDTNCPSDNSASFKAGIFATLLPAAMYLLRQLL